MLVPIYHTTHWHTAEYGGCILLCNSGTCLTHHTATIMLMDTDVPLTNDKLLYKMVAINSSLQNYFIYQLQCTILYSLTICMLHYYPGHVSSINMPIFRRTNCIHTASGIVALCKRLHSTPVESRLQSSESCSLKLYKTIFLWNYFIYQL